MKALSAPAVLALLITFAACGDAGALTGTAHGRKLLQNGRTCPTKDGQICGADIYPNDTWDTIGRDFSISGDLVQCLNPKLDLTKDKVVLVPCNGDIASVLQRAFDAAPAPSGGPVPGPSPRPSPSPPGAPVQTDSGPPDLSPPAESIITAPPLDVPPPLDPPGGPSPSSPPPGPGGKCPYIKKTLICGTDILPSDTWESFASDFKVSTGLLQCLNPKLDLTTPVKSKMANIQVPCDDKIALQLQQDFDNPPAPSPPFKPFEFPDTELGRLQKQFVDEHNRVRAQHEGTGPLMWDEVIAKQAQRFIDGCPDDHYIPALAKKREDLPAWFTINDVGESLGLGPSTEEPGKSSVQGWYGEIENYDFTTGGKRPGKTGDPVGHFANVVWKQTTRIGCAFQKGCRPPSWCPECEDKPTYEMVVCEYYPPSSGEGGDPVDYKDNIGRCIGECTFADGTPVP